MANQLSATLGSTVFPLISLHPSTAAPAEPERRLTGRASLAHRENTYYTEVNDFSGPFGQELWDMDSLAQGFRDGGLQGGEGYLILPMGIDQEVDPHTVEPTTLAIYPGNVGLTSARSDVEQGQNTAKSDYRQFVAVGAAIWRSDSGLYTFTEPLTYAAATISFASATKKISDSADGLAGFTEGRSVVVSGSTDNDGTYTIVDVAYDGSYIEVSEALTNENAGATVTLTCDDNPKVFDFVDEGEAVTQITGLVRVDISATARRWWVSGASETGRHKLYYSDDARTFTASALYGEAIIVAGRTLGGSYPEIIIAESNGKVYREASGITIIPESSGRVVFLGTSKRETYVGVWLIKGGNLMFIGWDRISRNLQVAEYATELPYLVHGTVDMSSYYTADPIVTDGWNVWRVRTDRTEWLGLPPHFTGLGEIRYLDIANGSLWAVVASDSPPTHGTSDTSILMMPILDMTGVPAWHGREPIWEPFPWERWQIVGRVGNQTGYALHFGQAKVRSAAVRKGLLMAYDDTESYIHSFTMPGPTGVVLPQGIYDDTAERVMPIFDGGMPKDEGAWVGVDIFWVFPDNTGSIQFHRRIGTATSWTQVGSTINGSSVGSASKAVYGVTAVDESTAQAFTTIETRPTITCASPYNKSPRILKMVYKWEKHQSLRYSFALEVNADQYMRDNAKEYDDLLTDIATLYDTSTPLTLTIDGWSTSYTVRFAKRGGVTPDPQQALRGDKVGNPILLLEETE